MGGAQRPQQALRAPLKAKLHVTKEATVPRSYATPLERVKTRVSVGRRPKCHRSVGTLLEVFER